MLAVCKAKVAVLWARYKREYYADISLPAPKWPKNPAFSPCVCPKGLASELCYLLLGGFAVEWKF